MLPGPRACVRPFTPLGRGGHVCLSPSPPYPGIPDATVRVKAGIQGMESEPPRIPPRAPGAAWP